MSLLKWNTTKPEKKCTQKGIKGMQATLFDVREFEGTPAPLTPKHRWLEENGYTCRQCKHRQRWECESGVRIIQYCGVRRSNRTENGLLHIKVTNKACYMFELEGKKIK